MSIYFEHNALAKDLRYEDQSSPTHAAYWEDGQDPVFTRSDPPSIAHFGASSGSGNHALLTLNASQLPIDITISADLTGATRWEIQRVVGAASVPVAAGSTQRAFYQEPLTSTFKPDSDGWSYLLTVWKVDVQVHATARVRLVTVPTLSSFSATAPVGVQIPAGTFQRSYLTWEATAGDPDAVWSLTQSGQFIAHLPSSQHLTPAAGRAAGNHRQFVQISGTPGGRTTLTLTGRNEAGQVSRDVSITWAGGG